MLRLSKHEHLFSAPGPNRRVQRLRSVQCLTGGSKVQWPALVAPVFFGTYRRYRNRKTIICPETGQIAKVELKALRASLMSTLGKHSVRVKWCSLWPRKKGCAEECVKEYWTSERDEHSVRADRSKPN